jgi:hypothetical protein
LTQLTRKVTSRNGLGEAFYSSFLPGDDPDGAPYWLPDYTTSAWGTYAASALDRIRETPGKIRAEADALLDRPRLAYYVPRWSERRDSADKAAPTFVRYPGEQRTWVAECREV